jgi:hypothetical protein
MKVKKRIDPTKIFFRYKCRECSYSTDVCITEEIGEPFCENDEKHEMEYKYTYMVTEKNKQPLKNTRTKTKPQPLSRLEYNRTQYLIKKEEKNIK